MLFLNRCRRTLLQRCQQNNDNTRKRRKLKVSPTLTKAKLLQRKHQDRKSRGKLSPNFVMFQNFKHQIACITMQKKLPTLWHDSNRVCTTSKKHIFNLHQIATSDGNLRFFWPWHGQKIRSECTKIRHFKFKIYFSSPDPSLRWGRVPSPHLTPHPHQVIWILHNSSQIYAAGKHLSRSASGHCGQYAWRIGSRNDQLTNRFADCLFNLDRRRAIAVASMSAAGGTRSVRSFGLFRSIVEQLTAQCGHRNRNDRTRSPPLSRSSAVSNATPAPSAPAAATSAAEAGAVCWMRSWIVIDYWRTCKCDSLSILHAGR